MNNNEKILWPGWETVRLIGRGSFGTVYEIQRQIFDEVEKAALKIITIPQNNGDIEEMYSEGFDTESITATFNSHLKSIVAEYSLMRKIDGSANIVNCKDIRYIQHDDGIGWDIFIRMELLNPLMKALPVDVTEETVIKIGKDICNALVLCKKHEIIHRDIKPQNIFVSPNGDYKLGDFGIAKTVEKTMGGTKIGTYKYMAPEVYNNQPYGSSADIYSLGLVLYWLLNERRMPFMPPPPAKLMAGQDEEARQRRLSGEQLPLPAHGSDELKQIVLKACAYEPHERYASAAEMLDDLNKLGTVSATTSPSVTESNDATVQEAPEQDTTMQMALANDVSEKEVPAQVPVQDDDKTVRLFYSDAGKKNVVKEEVSQEETVQQEVVQKDDAKTEAIVIAHVNNDATVAVRKVKNNPQNVAKTKQSVAQNNKEQKQKTRTETTLAFGVALLALSLCILGIIIFGDVKNIFYRFFVPNPDYRDFEAYTVEHLILSLTAVVVINTMFLIRRIRVKKLNRQKMLRTYAILLSSLEAIRIFINFESLTPDFYAFLHSRYFESQFMVSYCILFIFALWMAGFGKNQIKRTGEVFLAYGSPLAGIVYLIIPTLHYLSYGDYFTLHGILYHTLMIYVGLSVLSEEKCFTLKSFASYSIFVAIFGVLSIFLNTFVSENIMHLEYPDMDIVWLSDFNDSYHVIYTAILLLGYILQPIFVALITGKIKFKRNGNNIISNENKTV